MSMVEVVGSYVNADQGTHEVTTAEASAGSVSIATRLRRITNAIVQVVDSGNNVVTSDADISWSDGTLIVADGSTFAVTATYVIRYLAFGEGGA